MSVQLPDLEHIRAIDVHAHVARSTRTEDRQEGELHGAARRFFTSGEAAPTVHDVAEYFRSRNMMAVVFPVNSKTGTGSAGVPSDEVAELAAGHSDVLIPFASVDPWDGARAVAEVHRLAGQYNVRGFKFHPVTQAFFPNEERFYPIYEAIESYGLISIFHTGQTMMGRSLPGGGGIRLKYANPIYLDDVAADFPNMPLIMAHPSVPWQDEALSIALHKRQVYIDLSGWSAKYFPPQLIQYANTLLKHKILFGSDYPLFTPDRWLADFEQAPFRDEVRPLILKYNAARLFGLLKEPPKDASD
jgi:predicted TIM-barrel fold metal-dependent hydrolase